MAINMYLPDGRDFDDVFYKSNGGQTTGFKIADGTDIGNRYVAGNSGITTGYKNSAGVDLGSILGTQAPYTHTIKISKNIDRISGESEYWYTATYWSGTVTPVSSVVGTISMISTTSEVYDYNYKPPTIYTSLLLATQLTSSHCFVKRMDTGVEWRLNRVGAYLRANDFALFSDADVGKTIQLIIRI